MLKLSSFHLHNLKYFHVSSNSHSHPPVDVGWRPSEVKSQIITLLFWTLSFFQSVFFPSSFTQHTVPNNSLNTAVRPAEVTLKCHYVTELPCSSAKITKENFKTHYNNNFYLNSLQTTSNCYNERKNEMLLSSRPHHLSIYNLTWCLPLYSSLSYTDRSWPLEWWRNTQKVSDF